jgi:hypothetical protein
MNQIEQWFGLVQRKRLRISDFTDLDHLAERLMAFVAEWNAHAHPFNWSTKSAAKVSHGQVPSSASLGSSHMNSASFFCGCVLSGLLFSTPSCSLSASSETRW